MKCVLKEIDHLKQNYIHLPFVQHPSELSQSVRRSQVFARPESSYAEFIAETWRTICEAVQVSGAESEQALTQLLDLIAPWGSERLGAVARYPSYVAHDGFPAEFSVSWRNGRPEIRILFESLGSEATALSCQTAGCNLTRRLASQYGVNIDRYLEIEDLFITPMPTLGRPTVWHSLAWRPGTPPLFKVYLNPQAQGVGREAEITMEAVRRLGMDHIWQPLDWHYCDLRKKNHCLEFIALDLGKIDSRIKVYFRHGPMPYSEINAVASFAQRHNPNKLAEVLRLIYQDTFTHPGDIVTNEPMTCLAFRENSSHIDEANVYLRIPGIIGSDAVAAQRTAAVLACEGIDPQNHLRLMTALGQLGQIDLERVSGIQELISFRTLSEHQPADICVYMRFSAFPALEQHAA